MSKKEQVIQATLVSGNVYVLNGRFFEYGQPMPVSVPEMKHLQKHAIIRNKSSNGKVFLEQQFSFETIEDSLDELVGEQVIAAPQTKKQDAKKNKSVGRPVVAKSVEGATE